MPRPSTFREPVKPRCMLAPNPLWTRLKLRAARERVSTSALVCRVMEAYLKQTEGKLTTQSVPGGNTDSIYAEGTLAKSEMLARLHPDVARVAERWNRDHHYVDYSPFQRNRLRLLPSVELPRATDDHGMVIQDLVDDRWVTRA